MEVEVSKENICINKLVAEKKELIFIQNDMIVPDSKPDILNTINVAGNVCVYKKDISEDKVKIDGNINTYIMYLPDSKDDNLRALNCKLDFSESITVPGAREGMILVTNCVVKDLECKVINGRKVNVKAGVEFCIKIYSNEEVEIINKINNINDVQTLNNEFLVNSLIGNGKTVIYAKDTINIDAKDELAEILKVDIKLVDRDLKLSYNKVLTKAEAEVKIMYLTEDNRIGKVVGKIPVIGFIDIQNISEENICDINYEMKNMQFKPNSAEEHSIYVELEIESSCMAYEKRKISLIQDLYSPSTNLEFSQKRISSLSDKLEMKKEYTVQDKVQIPGLEAGNLLNVEVAPNLANTSVTESKITYSGTVDLNFIFMNANSLNSRNAKIPFEVIVDNDEKNDNINVETEIMIVGSNFDVGANGEVNAKIDMEIFTKTSKNVNMNIIDNIQVSEVQNEDEEDYNSLILYIARPGDTLWEIAKKFNSTVDELSRMNGIEDSNNIAIGQKIYIPKFNYIKKDNKDNATEQVFL